ncbi:MAG: ATP-dependent DNA helicase RecG [Phycisphaeraceae bacterium]
MSEPAAQSDARADSTELKLGSPVSAIAGVTRHRATLLRKLDIHTVSDLLRHEPMRYQFEAGETKIADLTVGAIGQARGRLEAVRWVGSPYGGRGRGPKGRFEATLVDDTDTLSLTWFNARYLKDQLHAGDRVIVQGKVTLYNDYAQMANPKWERLPEEGEGEAGSQRVIADDRLRPIYPATKGLSSTAIEQLIEQVLPRVLPQLDDPLPESLRREHNMPSLAEALRMLHQPEDEDEPPAARRRLAYNELLLLQLGVAVRKAYVQRCLSAPPLRHDAALDRHISDRLPFDLTAAQRKVVQEIAHDLTRASPMNRLLQGDVGSGKTAVAVYAMLLAVANRKRAAMLAPTELLARQHMLSLEAMLEGSSVRMALLTGSMKPPERRKLVDRTSAGDIDLLVGTHALLSDADRSVVPHQMVMTATPIPRTLSLTLLGDLEVSTIDELPPGRTPVTTRVVDPSQSDTVYDYIHGRLRKGEQAYFVVPAIDAESTGGNELKTVTQHVQTLRERFGPDLPVEAVHGRMEADELAEVMSRFRRGEVSALVATTVIEVGVDVPAATVMVVEHAERFGLAQLHQLRGRVGRGSTGGKPLCVLIAEPTTDDATARMEAIRSTRDGFRIAEKDLEIRGMGEMLGTRQSGAPPLRTARIPDDMDLLKLARRDARAIVDQNPSLSDEKWHRLRKLLIREYGETLGLVDAG